MSEVKPRSSAGSRSRKRLAPSGEVRVVRAGPDPAGEAQREAAAKFGVETCSTVVHVCKTAKQGALDALAASVPGRRPGQSPEQAELAAARAEIERLRATVTEQAVELHLHKGKIALGLTAGPVPASAWTPPSRPAAARPDRARDQRGGMVKQRQTAAALGIEHVRLLRWQASCRGRRLQDARPGPDQAPHALAGARARGDPQDRHGLEAQSIGRTAAAGAPRGHGGRPFYATSESTVLRVLTAEGVRPCPERPPRERGAKRALAGVGRAGARGDLDLRLHALPGEQAVRGRGAGRGLAVLVGHRRLGRGVSTQVEVAFTRALVADGKEHLLDQDLLEHLAYGVVPDDDERVPVLLAVSDNGPQMTSRATAVFMAGARIAQHFGRPSTPNDQAWVESCFGHLKGEHLAPGEDRRSRRPRGRAGPAARSTTTPSEDSRAPRIRRVRG